MPDNPTQADVHRMMSYDNETGRFRWRDGYGKASRKGGEAGSPATNGYRRIMVFGKNYPEHHIVWLYHHGEMPARQIDHIDVNRQNNRIENLRPSDQCQNMQNIRMPSTNTSGYIGASWNKTMRKWTAQISVGREQRHLGVFDTPQEANAAYLAAKAKFHTFCPQPRE